MRISDLEYFEDVSAASEIVGGSTYKVVSSLKTTITSLTDDILKEVNQLLKEVKGKKKSGKNYIVTSASVKSSKSGVAKALVSISFTN